jgi:hypothetical protein
MGCHLGWYSTVGCPLRVAEENKNKITSGPPKAINRIKQKTIQQLKE